MIQEDLEKLNVAAFNLNEQRDHLNALYELLEVKLKNISAGIAARVQTPQVTTKHTSEDAIIFLEYGKHQGVWGLYIFHVGVLYSLREVPARILVKAVSLIPALLEELVRNTEWELKNVKEANTIIKEVVKGMTE